MNKKANNISKWIPSIIAACIVVMSASMKISGKAELAAHYTELGLFPYMKWFGAAELTFIALFLYPRTMKPAFLLLTAYFGGAIATEVPHGIFFLFPAAILTLVWIAAWFRIPSMFGRKENTFHLQ